MHTINPELDKSILLHLDAGGNIHSKIKLEEMGCLTCPTSLTTPRIMTVARNFACRARRTSIGYEQPPVISSFEFLFLVENFFVRIKQQHVNDLMVLKFVQKMFFSKKSLIPSFCQHKLFSESKAGFIEKVFVHSLTD